MTLSRISKYDDRDCIPMRSVGGSSSTSSSLGTAPVSMTTRTNGFHPPVHQLQHQQRLQQLQKQHMQRHHYLAPERSESPASHLGMGGDYPGDDSCVLVPEERVGLLAKNAARAAPPAAPSNGHRNGAPPAAGPKKNRKLGECPSKERQAMSGVGISPIGIMCVPERKRA
ncbi:unnamed protein product [Notodromas monacha]|uniref:Uncharacterized protein n=1 Tax=Notodromas monacha TaxID=399045 RepID=A0A7R9BP56_9CRUS|nr:unnamed protein product [Notodromas monacha]CAG0918813.1 unnamed protein product [Notodromas monacha]